MWTYLLTELPEADLKGDSSENERKTQVGIDNHTLRSFGVDDAQFVVDVLLQARRRGLMGQGSDYSR